MVVTRKDHHQRFLHEKTERQPWHPFFPSKKSCIDFSLRKTVRKQRGVLTRYHHVDVREFIAQDPHGLGHPRQFVAGQKTHCEARLAGSNRPACSSRRPLNLPYHPPPPTNK